MVKQVPVVRIRGAEQVAKLWTTSDGLGKMVGPGPALGMRASTATENKQKNERDKPEENRHSGRHLAPDLSKPFGIMMHDIKQLQSLCQAVGSR